MKILHIARQFYPCIGGVENFVLNLVKEQKAMGHDVSVLTLDRNFADGRAIAGPDPYEGITIIRIPFWGSRRYPIAPSCINYVKEFDILHIHCVDFFLDYLVLLRPWHKKKIILHTHGGYFHTQWMRFAKMLYFNIVTRLALRGCSKIIACSESDQALFGRISKNVFRVDNGVDVARFLKIKKNIEPRTLLYIGRVDANKRIDNLIRTVAEIFGMGSDVRLKILGPDYSGLVPKLEKLTSDLGLHTVEFLGVQDDDRLAEELSKAHFFVSASEYEAFGISAVEATASGTLCVLNNIKAFNDLVVTSGAGFLTDYSDVKGSAGLILKLLVIGQQEYEAMALQAKEAVKKYDWRSVAEDITRLYS